MLQSKFKELVHSFLDGEITAVELGWLADELQRNEERRVGFREEVEMFIATQKAISHDQLPRRLEPMLKLDLANVQEHQLRRFLPRKLSGATRYDKFDLPEAMESEPKTGNIKKSSGTPRRKSGTKQTKQKKEAKEATYWMPAFGIVLLLGFFSYLIFLYSKEINSQEQGGQQYTENSADHAVGSTENMRNRLASFREQTAGAVLLDSEADEDQDAKDIPIFLRIATETERPLGKESISILQQEIAPPHLLFMRGDSEADE